MNKATFSLFCIFFVLFAQVSAQIPSGYYNTVNGKKGKELQIALNQIIKNHRVVSYTPEVWIYYQYTDLKPNGKIWDIYSDNPNGTPAYEFNYRTDQCVSTSSKEGECYQREHSFCQNWFGGSTTASYYSDIFHLYPVDGSINNKRSNDPYGVAVAPITYTFTNGSKIGINNYPDAPKVRCFEPIDDFKGDIARSFFYMATRYMFEDENFLTNSPMTNKSQLQPWAVAMLLDWHLKDQVSQKEIDRNNAIYAVQKNRNPFIDHPEWVSQIWGKDSIHPVQIAPEPLPERPKIKWFALTDSRTVKMIFTQPMITWTIENPLNYYIGETVAVTSLHNINDTLVIHLGGLFSQNITYNLSIKHLLAENMAFLKDTVVSFFYPYKIEQKPLLAWTFDNLQASPNTPNRISADYHLLDTVSDAVLYCDGTYQSSVWLSASSGTELNSFTGTTSGDPRPSPYAGKDIAFVNNKANGKSVVFKFPTKGYFNLAMSMAIQRSNQGFNKHQWEWSLDGENYTSIENTTTCPLTSGAPHIITTLNLSDIDELNDQQEVFLRLTLDGCNSATSNNRFDNITLHGVPISYGNLGDLKKKDNRFFIAPNPNRGQFQIINHYVNDDYNIGFVIYNSFGQAIKTGNLEDSFIDISDQPNGLFFLKIAGECLKVVKY